MQAHETLRAIIKREGHTMREVSRMYGRTDEYISATLGRRSNPNTDVMAGILDVMDYDLLARSRKDGTEFKITPRDNRKG